MPTNYFYTSTTSTGSNEVTVSDDFYDLLNSVVESPEEVSLEQEYPECEFYRGVPVFRVGDVVRVEDSFNTVVDDIRFDVIDEWLDRRDYTPAQVAHNIYYITIVDPDHGETYTEQINCMELIRPAKKVGKSGLTQFLEKHS